LASRRDIVAIAKPLAAGIPLGAFLVREKFASGAEHGKARHDFRAAVRWRVAPLWNFFPASRNEKLLERVRNVGVT